MQPTLQDIKRLAKAAGDILRAGYNHEHQVEYKGVIDLVTEIDYRSEQFLIDEITRQFPQHHILAEESGNNGNQNGNDKHIWYIDPLDGTVNYAHHIPIFAVSIAYAQGGIMKLAAVYDPMRDEMFSAEHNRGAWLNGTPIRVTTVTELSRSLMVTGFPYDAWETPHNNLDHFATLSRLTQGVRRLGSAALDLCYVAAGRFEGFWELELKPWDVAAAGLIASEAGAKVTTLHGTSDYITPPCSILAANPTLHQKMSALFNLYKE